MYVSLVMAYLGEAGILIQAWPIACLPVTIAYLNWIVIPVEEAKLIGVFGEGSRAIPRHVHRWV